MKKLISVILLIFIAGCAEQQIRVLETAEMGDVVIGANDRIAKPKMKFDIFRTGANDPNIEIPVARIIITRTTPTYSVGTIINRLDGSGSKPKSSDISKGMLCRKTTGKILKAEKKIYKYQKKALKRQYKLRVYESLGKTVQDANEIKSIGVGLGRIKVEKK